MALIQLNDLKNEKTIDLIEVKNGLENQLKKSNFLQPWQITIIKMHINDITNELNKRG